MFFKDVYIGVEMFNCCYLLYLFVFFVCCFMYCMDCFIRYFIDYFNKINKVYCV